MSPEWPYSAAAKVRPNGLPWLVPRSRDSRDFHPTHHRRSNGFASSVSAAQMSRKSRRDEPGINTSASDAGLRSTWHTPGFFRYDGPCSRSPLPLSRAQSVHMRVEHSITHTSCRQSPLAPFAKRGEGGISQRTVLMRVYQCCVVRFRCARSLCITCPVISSAGSLRGHTPNDRRSVHAGP